MTEEWRDIPGYEGRYQASSKGRIRNAQTGHVLKLGTGQDKRYRSVRLGHKGKKHLAHRLVAAAFHGAPKDGQQANLH
ncbi:MAG: NUMOD4 domain-containing protein [Thiohalorhabdus sp.]